MVKNKELKDKFNSYLVNNGKNTENLKDCVDYFSLKMFDVFLFGLKKYKKNPTGYLELFSSYVLPGLRYLKDDNFGDVHFKDKTYKKFKYLFFSFMDFCGENTEYVDKILFNNEKEKIEKLLEGNYGMFEKKLFIKNWHEFIKDDKGENGDKFRKYLSDVYLELNTKQIKILYELFFLAYEKCSDINYKNKKREKDKKVDAFNTAFSQLSTGLYDINVRGGVLDKIKSLFGKYLKFIPVYRSIIKDNFDENTTGGSNIQDEIKEQIIYSIRDPKGANYDIIDGEVVAPINNFGKFNSDIFSEEENNN